MIDLRRTMFLAAASLISASYAQNATNNCTVDKTFANGVNATGSISMPGIQVNSSYPSSTWTWSAYVGEKATSYDENTTTIATGFGLSTSPEQNLTDPSLPYQGCVLAIRLSSISLNNSIHDTGDCTSTFGSSCVSEIIKTANDSSSSISSTHTTSTTQCGTLLSLVIALSQVPHSTCYRLFDGGSSSSLTVINTTATATATATTTTTTTSSNCPITNPGNSNATSPAFVTFGDILQGKDNFDDYDADLVSPFPLLVSAWLVDGTRTVGGSGEAWADTRLVCVPRNQTISEGSRNVGVNAAATGTSSATPSPTETKKSMGVREWSVGFGWTWILLVVGMGLLV